MKVRAVDAHSSGAICRTVIGGLESLEIIGNTMLEKKLYIESRYDWLRTALLKEPRGFPAMNADLVIPPCHTDADVGLVIMNQRPIGPVMSGGNILAFATAILESGTFPIDRTSPVTVVKIDTPGGLVIARATCRGDKVLSVAIENVASFATHLDERIDVPGVGGVTVDVAYGGMFYVILDGRQLGCEIDPPNADAICRAAERVRTAAAGSIAVDNPASPTIRTVDQVLVAGQPRFPENSGRSAVVMPMLPGLPTHAEGVNALIDRCPCGTGTMAQVAALVAKGKLAIGEPFRQESIIDEVYTVTALRAVDVNGRRGIVPELVGSAHVVAETTLHINDEDPLRHGFTVGDMWPGRVPAASAT